MGDVIAAVKSMPAVGDGDVCLARNIYIYTPDIDHNYCSGLTSGLIKPAVRSMPVDRDGDICPARNWYICKPDIDHNYCSNLRPVIIPEHRDHTYAASAEQYNNYVAENRGETSHRCGILDDYCDKFDWACHLKDYITRTHYGLKKHIPTNTGDKPYSCIKCHNRFRRASELNRHMKDHTRENNFLPCVQCNTLFRRAVDLNRHMKTHTGENPIPCVQSNNIFSGPSKLKRHRKIHTREKTIFLCQHCGKLINKLKTHISAYHNRKKTICLCQHCGKLIYHLKKHMCTHHIGEKLILCHRCGQRFNSPGQLNIHMKRHSVKKPYACIICDKWFIYAGRLKIHMRTHSEQFTGK